MTLNVPQLLAQIETEWAGITGWCPLEKAYDLALAVLVLRPVVVCEIGVWGGKSLIPMALACESINSGRVFAIDPWSGQASSAGYTGENFKWWSAQDHEKVYKSFVGHVDRLALKDRVVIQRSTSNDANVPEEIDLISVDGQHTDQAVMDVNRFCSRVRVGGIVMMDDLGWNNDGELPVAKAIDRLFELGFIELFRKKTAQAEWAAFQRISPEKPKRGRPRK